MSIRRAAALGAVILATLGATAAAQTRRPTPHEALDRATAPVRAALDGATPTEDERRDVAALLQLAESTAAELVAAEHRRMPDVVTARRRRLARLAEAVRARVDALRAEAAADRAEAAALEADARRQVAQGALERAAERRLSADRGEPVSTWRLPAPQAPAPAADAGVSP